MLLKKSTEKPETDRFVVPSDLPHEEILLNDESALNDLVYRIKKLIRIGDVFFLHGDLGAGKTTFVQNMLKLMNTSIEVTSPTYAYVHAYELHEYTIYHVDLYRIDNFKTYKMMALDEDWLAESSLLFIEWPFTELRDQWDISAQWILHFKWDGFPHQTRRKLCLYWPQR